jgi:carboxypeptidase C (cathepsin A)
MCGWLAWKASAIRPSGEHHFIYPMRGPSLTYYVRMYTGYVDIEAKHFFFWFFESRRDPDEDDVVLWLNGGTSHCSALIPPCSLFVQDL